VAQHFLERGHKHFAWLNAYEGPVVSGRRAGFLAGLAEAGRTAELIDYPAGDWTRRRLGLVRRLRALPRPLALLALDDQLAAEVIEVCLESGLRVPEDIAVAGIGNIELACETSHVPITSVDLASEATAESAAHLLDRLMRGGKPPARPLVVPPAGLVVRRSSSALAATNPAVVRATQYIAQQLARPLDMDGLAAAAGVSRRSLYNLFAAELARTPADHLRDERLARARQLLAETDDPIAEIAEACGFGTIRTLNRVFLAVEGISPRTWRRGRTGPAPESSSRS
jgi:LacI family transcriptional regulator